MREVVVACELGPNPAPISELIWALRVQRGLRVRRLHLLTNRYGERYLHELHLALDLLREVFGDAPALSALLYALDGEGHRVDEDLTAGESAAWMRARWRNLRRAIADAGSDPVVFAIASNRERSVLTTGMYTLLARPGDLCLDVRVSEPRVEGARANFFFPDQPTWCADEQGPIDPRTVEVSLVELRLPQLRGLLHGDALASYDAALAASRTAVADAERPEIVVNLAELSVTIRGVQVPLTASQFLWYAALSLARAHSADGWVAGSDTSWLSEALELSRLARGTPAWTPPSTVFKKLGGDDLALDDSTYRKLRSKTRSRLKDFCEEQHLLHRELVIPSSVKKSVEGGVTTLQRIALEPERITIRPRGYGERSLS